MNEFMNGLTQEMKLTFIKHCLILLRQHTDLIQ